ncbi:hypothetical protein JTE90_022015 [Oedothorax gibbosus]|uniref:Uncharacterized protein n=1 Tax=Oedothorax gibbosus TaxID=931172 RepID=A0AAV6V185_9ARAC|nr:hypothetical protein JTE90_022015 [Oedothorax gibbosus]
MPFSNSTRKNNFKATHIEETVLNCSTYSPSFLLSNYVSKYLNAVTMEPGKQTTFHFCRRAHPPIPIICR